MFKLIKLILRSKIFRIFLLIISILWIIFLPHLWDMADDGNISGLPPKEEQIFTDGAAEPVNFRQISEALAGFKQDVPEIAERDLEPLHRIFKLAACKPDLRDNAERRAQFLAVHGSACAMLIASGETGAAGTYATQLEAAAGNELVWSAVEFNPAALAVTPLLTWENRELSDFFMREAEWLAELLAWQDVPDAPEERMNTIINYIEIARRHHPLVRELFYAFNGKNPELLGELFFLADNFSDVLEQTGRNNIPLAESAEVLAVSPSIKDYRSAVEIANLLTIFYNRDKALWQQLREVPHFFTLYTLAPEDAEALLTEFGTDLPGFIVIRYPDVIPYAANAVRQSGDTAIVILETYHALPEMDNFLSNPSLRRRLIPFIGRFGDEAFAMLSDDPRWAERYFLPDGTPNPEATTVIDMLPIIGAPYTLGRNLLMGYPSSWGEVGWAALDIADGFLLIASFGSSTPLSAAKGVAKSSLKAVEKNITRIPLRQAGRDILSAAAKRSWRLAAKNSVRFGAGLATGSIKPLWSAIRKTHTLWRNTPPAVRKWSSRAMLGAGLYITITERSAKQYPEAMSNLAETLSRITEASVEHLNNAMQDAVNTIIDAYAPRHPWQRRVVSITGLIILFFLWNAALRSGKRQNAA